MYYQLLLGSKTSSNNVTDAVVKKGRTCSEAHVLMLMQRVTQAEIKEVMFNIPNDKAPGPDGYSSKFFKDTWDIIGEEIGPCAPRFISQTQGGFIHGRSIIENILIFQDIIRMYEKDDISPRCLIKMDLQKAYDTIEWDFLDQMLIALKFPDVFRGWIMQCVSTATYSINLNGNMFGFFKGQRGLRQWDPLSPLLFTICMEYLTWLLNYITETRKFNYHPLCKPMRLTHLMFADDLLLFCKGDANSMMLILRTFATFSSSSGLKMREGKSNVYLGVPIKTTRLTSKDCNPLIDDIVNRIRSIGAKKLSYAGRNFLWDGGVDFMRSPLVAWDKVCKPKKEGGLGLKQDSLWIMAAVGKLVWWIATKADILWVRWVNHTYLKGSDWHTYYPTNYSSWYWRKVCQVRVRFQQAYQQNTWENTPQNGYTIAKGYDFLRERATEVSWHALVWNKWNIPKHSFLAWVYHHGNMNTNQKLYRLGICADDICSACGAATESVDHLFFACDSELYFSRLVLFGVVSPVIVQVSKDKKIHKRFSFLNSWMDHHDYLAIITAALKTDKQGSPMFSFFDKLKSVKKALYVLHKTDFANISLRFKQAKASLVDCQARLLQEPLSATLIQEEKSKLLDYTTLKDTELNILSQRAKTKHIQGAGCCSKYFFAKISERRH
ncbi:uncharacterized protein LOC141649160 [Silene latifolia]|uniref:uncharacterized protein LOC141649160 n=1 Tax=Silene latifolia TaxID=37657 RepID=UPI003D7825BC